MNKTTTKQRPKIGIYITKRDTQAMQTLARLGLLRESTLHRLCFPTLKHQRHVHVKLKRLVDNGYISRRLLPIIRSDREFIDFTHQERREAIYLLSEKGAGLLGQAYDPNQAKLKLQSLYHRLDITDIRACLELALQKTKDITLAVWYNENDKDEDGFVLHDSVTIKDPHTNKQQKLSIRPDACFILEEEKTAKQALFFLEIDEGTESGRKRWKDKVSAYLAYWKEGFKERFEFKGQGFRVLTVNRSETGKEQHKRKANLVETTHKAGGRKQFWFASFDEVMPEGKVSGDHLLTSPIWKRVDKDLEEEEISLCDYLF